MTLTRDALSLLVEQSPWCLPRSVPAMPPADRDYVQLRATRGVLAAAACPGRSGGGTHLRSSRLKTARAGAPLMVSTYAAIKPVRAMGGFFAMTLDTFVQMFKPPFAWKEYILQSWFVARVSVLPALMLTMPYSVLLVFTFNVLLTEFGASDFSGTGAAIGTVNQIGPIVTVLVVSGAGATAMCADLGRGPFVTNSTRCG